MKRVIFSLLALISLTASANHHITAEQAMERVGIASPTSRGMHRAKALSGADDLYYVFNLDGGGYVIASADDRARAILGRCDQGEWNPGEMPPAMQGWLESMSEALRLLAADPTPALGSALDGATAKPVSRAASTRVEPLLGGIKWGQNTPYNNLCPASGQTHSATGCAATAMAQIMRYHKWPLEGRGSNTYSTSTIGGTISENFTGTHYDWANMLEQYFLTVDGRPNNYNETQATAVATLMYHLGVASSMDYNTGASGTTEGPMLQAMVENFDYDRSLQIYYRENFTSQEWYTLLQDEIDNERPVLMNGYSISGGHAFVIDGYDTTMGQGYFHFNWGWNGMSDGYYSVDITDPGQQGTGGSLGGYSYNQNIFTHITKQAGGSAEPNLCVSAALRYEYGQLHFQALNRGCGAFTGEIGYVVEDNGARGFHSVQAYSGMGFREGTGSKHVSISAPTKAGLRYYLATKVGSTITELRPIVGATHTLVSVSDGKGGFTLIPEASDLAQLQVTNIELEGHAYAGATTNFRITVRNVGQTEYNAALYMCVTETNDNGDLGYSDLATGNPLGVYLRPGEENTYSFPFYSTLAVGKYLAEVFYNPRNGSGVQLVNGESLTFDVVPFGSLDEEKNPPVLEIYEQSLTPAKIYADSELSFSVTVDNAGGTDETTVGGIIYKKNGNNWQQIGILDEKTISIAEGESTLTFTGTPELEIGRYRISLGYNDGIWWQFSQGKYTTFSVEEEPEEPIDPEPGPGPGEPVAGEASVTALSLANGTTAPAKQAFYVNYEVLNLSEPYMFEFLTGVVPLDAEGNPVGEYSVIDPWSGGNSDALWDDLPTGATHSGQLWVQPLNEGRYRIAVFNLDWKTAEPSILPGLTLDVEVGEGSGESVVTTYDYLVRFTGDVPNDPSVVIKGQTYTSRFGGSIWLESEELAEDDIIADMDGYNVIVNISGNAEDGFTITVDYQHEWVLRLINAPADATVNVDGTERTTGVFSAAFVTVVAAEYDNYDVDVQVDRTKHTITATYTPWPTWTVEVIGADEETTVRINDIDYKNGDRFHAKNVNLDDVEPSAVSGRVASVTRVGYTIKVTYVRETDLSGNYKFKFTNGRYISFANGSAAAVEDASQATVFTVALDEDADLYSIYVNENNSLYLGSHDYTLNATAAESQAARWTIRAFIDGLDNEGYSLQDILNTSSTPYLGFNNSAVNKAPRMSGAATVIAFVPVTYPLGMHHISLADGQYLKAAPSADAEDPEYLSEGFDTFTSVPADDSDINTLWTVEAAGENTCYIKHVNSGAYLSDASSSDVSLMEANYKAFAGVFEYVKEGNNIYLKNGSKYMKLNGTKLQGSATASQVCEVLPVETVTYSLNASGYGTLCLPFDFVLPEGLKACVLSGDGDVLDVVPMHDAVVAREGYIMIGTPNTSYTLEITRGGEYPLFNHLRGTLCRETGLNPDNTVFYGLKTYAGENGAKGRATLTRGNTTAIPANKAFFFPADNQTRNYSLHFSDDLETEAVNNIMQDMGLTPSASYDLQGRRVQGRVRGVMIVNGNKIIR